MPNFTTEDLLVYLYEEMTIKQKTDLEKELQNNWALKEKYLVLKEARHRFEKINQLSPRRKTIEAILEYAASDSKVIS